MGSSAIEGVLRGWGLSKEIECLHLRDAGDRSRASGIETIASLHLKLGGKEEVGKMRTSRTVGKPSSVQVSSSSGCDAPG